MDGEESVALLRRLVEWTRLQDQRIVGERQSSHVGQALREVADEPQPSSHSGRSAGVGAPVVHFRCREDLSLPRVVDLEPRSLNRRLPGVGVVGREWSGPGELRWEKPLGPRGLGWIALQSQPTLPTETRTTFIGMEGVSINASLRDSMGRRWFRFRGADTAATVFLFSPHSEEVGLTWVAELLICLQQMGADLRREAAEEELPVEVA